MPEDIKAGLGQEVATGRLVDQGQTGPARDPPQQTRLVSLGSLGCLTGSLTPQSHSQNSFPLGILSPSLYTSLTGKALSLQEKTSYAFSGAHFLSQNNNLLAQWAHITPVVASSVYTEWEYRVKNGRMGHM